MPPSGHNCEQTLRIENYLKNSYPKNAAKKNKKKSSSSVV